MSIIVMSLSLTSCITEAYAQVDDIYDNVDIGLVVRYGTPYYNTDGLLMYYIYRNLYYYPYYHHNRYYLHRYRRPLPYYLKDRYRPVPRDSYRNYYKYKSTPRNSYNKQHYGNSPNKGINTYGHGSNNWRSSINSRPSMNNRQMQRMTPSRQGGNGTFGGRR